MNRYHKTTVNNRMYIVCTALEHRTQTLSNNRTKTLFQLFWPKDNYQVVLASDILATKVKYVLSVLHHK